MNELSIPDEVRAEARASKPSGVELKLVKQKELLQGLDQVAPDLRALQEWLAAAFASRDVLCAPLGEDSLEKLHALMIGPPPRDNRFGLAVTVIETHGVEQVLTALLTPLRLTTGYSIKNKVTRRWLQRTSSDATSVSHRYGYGFWVSYCQSYFDALPSATRARFEALAEEQRPALDLGVRAALTDLFQRTDWAEADAAVLLALKPRPSGLPALVLPYLESEETFDALSVGNNALFSESTYIKLLVRQPPERAIRWLSQLLKQPLAGESASNARQILRLLSCSASAEAAAAVASAATFVPDAVKAYFFAHPQHVPLLAQHAKGRGKAPAAVKQLLLELERQQLAATEPAKPTAPIELPAVLAAPPWLHRTAPWPARDVPLIADGERVIESKALAELREKAAPGAASEAEILAKQTLLDDADFWALSDEAALASIGRLKVYALPCAIARFGARALPALAEVMNREPKKLHVELLVHFHSPRVAAVVFSFHGDEAWLLADPALAALGLVPELFVADRERRFQAELGLLRLCVAGHRAAVEASAARYGAELARETAQILDRDASQRLPEPLPALHRAFSDGSLPVLETEQGPLPPSTVASVGTLLSVSRAWLAHPGLLELRACCTRASRDAFAWEVYQKTWKCEALVHLGEGAVVRKIDGLLSAKRSSLHPTERFRLLEALGRLASPLAIVLLQKHALESPWRDRVQYIDAILEELSRVRGQPRSELEDEAFGALDVARDLPALDFGPRRFRVVLDGHLVPQLLDQAGHAVPKLPKPTKKDDAAKAEIAKQQLATLARDLDDVRDTVLTYFERALATGRTWSAERFQRAVVGHPLLLQVARRLVFSAGSQPFRVAEDASFADENDAVLHLAKGQAVRVAHPVELSAEQLGRFRQLFFDYEIIQPFPQLAREVFRLTAEERESSKLSRFAGRIVAAVARAKLLGAPGWLHENGMHKPFGARYATLSAKHHHRARVDAPVSEELLELTLHEGDAGAPFSTLSEVEASELLRDIETLPVVD